jgi:hypothetical protein
MDPFSIVSLVAGLLPVCGKIAKGLNDVHSKWTGANATISAISSETATLAAALTQIDQVARNDPGGLSNKLAAGNGQYVQDVSSDMT